MQCSKVAHKEVAEHVNFLLVFGLRGSSGFASTALERRPFSTADDAATVTSTTEALCCFTARHTHTHTLKISTNRLAPQKHFVASRLDTHTHTHTQDLNKQTVNRLIVTTHQQLHHKTEQH